AACAEEESSFWETLGKVVLVVAAVALIVVTGGMAIAAIGAVAAASGALATGIAVTVAALEVAGCLLTVKALYDYSQDGDEEALFKEVALGFLFLGAGKVIEKGYKALKASKVLKNPETQFGKLRMAYEYYKKLGWPKGRIRSHLDGIDFSKPVKLVELPKGKSVSQFQAPGGKKGNYFAEPNAKATELGINPNAEVGGDVVEKTKTIYETTTKTNVLESSAKSGIIDTWSVKSSPFETTGGGTQYFTDNSDVFVPKK
uniref:polymorphic toxin type 46 domain-containing protein n=1 Tax=uncultured Zobellia sp. TaxID=255433 RepID=UPI002597D43C